MWIARARPLLGTVVSIQAHTEALDGARVEQAISQAFAVIAHIGHVMSAHHDDSDLARMARAHPHEVLTLDTHTVDVIRAAQHWWQLSNGAFNPCHAAHMLSRGGLRPGIVGEAMGSLSDITIGPAAQVQLALPVKLDFGGIAKGYAVDQAIEVLAAHGIRHALVNAGGDLRAIGERHWPIDVRHANVTLMDGRLTQKTRLYQQALATSVAGELNPEFVFSRSHKKPRWRSVTVQASTCMTADVLTKWAMQASLLCPGLRATLRQNHARMWRTQ
jgi:thiamine biosynthesis lipoprotein